LLLLVIIGWLLLRPHPVEAPVKTPNPPARASAPTPPVMTAPAVPAAKPSAARTPAAKLPVAKPSPSAGVPPRPAAAAVPTDGRTVWRVVAYTYRGQTKASDMVAQISDKHSDLGAEVYSPPGRGTVYLVTLGGGMDHDAAVRMRDKAQREGLPADTYVQNFSR
jgi:SPOR domain